MIKLRIPSESYSSTYTWDRGTEYCEIVISDARFRVSLPITSTSLTFAAPTDSNATWRVSLTISSSSRVYTVTSIKLYYSGSYVRDIDNLNIFVIKNRNSLVTSDNIKKIIINGQEATNVKLNATSVWAKPYTITIYKNNDCFIYESEVATRRDEDLGGVKEPGDYLGYGSHREGSQAGNEVIRYPIYHGEYYRIDELIMEDGGIVDIHVLDTIGPVSSDVTYNAYCTGEGDYNGGGGNQPTQKWKAPSVSYNGGYIIEVTSGSGDYFTRPNHTLYWKVLKNGYYVETGTVQATLRGVMLLFNDFPLINSGLGDQFSCYFSDDSTGEYSATTTIHL